MTSSLRGAHQHVTISRWQMWRKRRARGVQARDKSKATKDPQAETGSTAAAGSVVAGWRLTKVSRLSQLSMLSCSTC